jgi:hypothetical protein
LLDTQAQLTTDVLQGLGYPAEEYLSVLDAYRAVTNALCYYLQILAQSNQNQIIRHVNFTPASRDVVMAQEDVPGSSPAWVERQIGNVPNETFIYVPTCNLNALEDARERGEMRCAFYSEQGQLHIRFSYNPQDYTYRTHRLWYDPAPQLANALNDPHGMPANFYPMPVARAITRCVPVMLIKSAQLQEDGKEVSPQLIAGWEAASNVANAEMKDFENRYKHYVFEAKGSERGRMRRNVLPVPRPVGLGWRR